MNAVTPIDASAEAGVDILALFEAKPEIVLTDPEKGAALYAASLAEVDAYVADVTTQKGRDAITSFAFRFTKRKTAIVAAGKALTEDWRKKTKAVNEARSAAEERFEALAIRAKKPLTDWETEESAKQARAKAAFDYLQNAPVVLGADTGETLTARLEAVRAYLLPNEFEAEHRDACERLRAIAIAALTTAIAEAKQKERDATDLAAFRASQAVAAPSAESDQPAPASTVGAYATFAPSAPPASTSAPPPTPAAPASDDQTLIILGRAKEDLMSVCGLDEPTARRVALALGRNQIRHFTVTLETRHAG
jgi:hypothetical protein